MIGVVKDILSILSKKQRKKYYLLQFFVVMTAIAEVVSLAFIGPFMAVVGDSEIVERNTIINALYVFSGAESPIHFMFLSGALVLGVLFISTITSIFTIWKLSYFAASTGAEIGNTLYEFYMNKGYLYHSAMNSSTLTKQIATESSRVTDHILQPFVQINARIVAVIFISLVVFAYDPLVSVLGLLIFFIAYYVLFVAVKGRLARNGCNISEVSRRRFMLMNEGFGSIKDVQVLNRQSDFVRQFKKSGDVFSEAYGSSNALYNTPRYIMEFIVYSGMISLTLFLLWQADGELSSVLPVLAVFGVAALKLLPSFQQIYSSAAQIKSNLSALNSIKYDLHEARSQAATNTACVGVVSSAGGLRLVNASFRYPGKANLALSNLSLSIPRRSIVGIVGASGSGKSTLLDVLLGVIELVSGDLLWGNTVINSNNVTSWQRNIGYVPQSIFIKDGSVIENVAFGLEIDQVDMHKLSNAISYAQLATWIESLPDGLMTTLGERGVQISGGQRQRIGIARALYNDAEFLFFDEATSALDGKTEDYIMRAIEKISTTKTIVMVAHRLNTIMKCDLIYIIDNGGVVDSGTYEYLFEHNAAFRQMAEGKFNEH